MKWYWQALIIYLLIINLLSAIITIYDKRQAITSKWRIKERTLLIFSALGGAPAMYGTMKLIRHKTQKMKFMVGIPAIFFSELAFFIFLVIYF